MSDSYKVIYSPESLDDLSRPLYPHGIPDDTSLFLYKSIASVHFAYFVNSSSFSCKSSNIFLEYLLK